MARRVHQIVQGAEALQRPGRVFIVHRVHRVAAGLHALRRPPDPGEGKGRSLPIQRLGQGRAQGRIRPGNPGPPA